jgi:hypothetical protein
MSVRCIQCDRWSLKKAQPDLSKLGLGRCEIKSITPGHTFSGNYERECESFREAPQETIAARRKWMKRKG